MEIKWEYKNIILKIFSLFSRLVIADHYLLSVLTARVKMNYLCNSQTYCGNNIELKGDTEFFLYSLTIVHDFHESIKYLPYFKVNRCMM